VYFPQHSLTRFLGSSAFVLCGSDLLGFGLGLLSLLFLLACGVSFVQFLRCSVPPPHRHRRPRPRIRPHYR